MGPDTEVDKIKSAKDILRQGHCRGVHCIACFIYLTGLYMGTVCRECRESIHCNKASFRVQAVAAKYLAEYEA